MKTSIFYFCFDEGTLLTNLTPKEQLLIIINALALRIYHDYEGFEALYVIESVEATYNKEPSPKLAQSGSCGSFWVVCVGFRYAKTKILTKVFLLSNENPFSVSVNPKPWFR